MPGCSGLEAGQPRDQPERRQRRKRGHRHMAPRLAVADLVHRAVQPLQQRHDGAQQRGAGRRELHMACAAVEQRRADLGLQRLDLAADGGLAQVQLGGRGAEGQAPGHRLEGTQGADGQGSGAVFHAPGLSIFSADLIGPGAVDCRKLSPSTRSRSAPWSTTACMTETHEPSWQLAAGQVQAVPRAPRGRWLVARAGRLWLTQRGAGPAR